MDKILFILLWIFSKFPFFILYTFSDILYFTICKLFGYRKKVVLENLHLAFPEKTNEEVIKIANAFYKNLCDQIVETIKLASISQKELNKRVTCNWEFYNKLEKNYETLYVLLGHQFNWEWANVASGYNAINQFSAFYLPLNNTIFDQAILRLRSRGNTKMVPATHFLNAFKTLKGQKHSLAFLADQVPGSLKIAYWFDFLNRPAPFFNGPEKLAIKSNAAVMYIDVIKIKRGYYHLDIIPICFESKNMQISTITGAYVAHLEKSLNQRPDNWLWSHRRWKKPLPEGEVIYNKQNINENLNDRL